MYAPLQGVLWLLCRLRHPTRTPAFSRPGNRQYSHWVKRFRTSPLPLLQTIEPVAARSTPGGLVTTRLAFGNQTPSTVPFGPGDSAVAPVIPNGAHTQVSRVSIGSGFDTQPPTAGSRCSLSPGFPPYPVPQDNAGCSTLTPLSWCSSFRAICTNVKWRTRTSKLSSRLTRA